VSLPLAISSALMLDAASAALERQSAALSGKGRSPLKYHQLLILVYIILYSSMF